MVRDNKPRYIICIKSYEVDDVKIEKGQVGMQAFGRPIMKPDLWREATKDEVKIIKQGGYKIQI